MWKDAKIGLIYFNAIVSNRMLEQFSGSATEILEVVIKILDQLSRSQFSPEIRYTYAFVLIIKNLG